MGGTGGTKGTGRACGRWRRGRAAAAVLGVVVLAGACGDASATRTEPAKPYTGCRAYVDLQYPDYPVTAAADWVSFGDHVAVFHVEDGSVEISGDDERSGRVVLDDVLFSREGARKAPTSFRAPLHRVPCEPWLVPGHTYVGLFVHDSVDREPAAWMPVHRGGLLPYDGESIGTGEIQGEIGETPEDERPPSGLSRQMHGEDAASLRSRLEGTEPYPAAAEHPELTPGERYTLVAKEREAKSTKE